MGHCWRIEGLLTTGEAARLLKVHPSTVRRWSERKRIKAYRIGPRGERRYRQDDLVSYLPYLTR